MSTKPSSLKISSFVAGSLRKIGGYQVFTHNLLSTLTQRDHQVTLYVPHYEYVKNKNFYFKLSYTVKPVLVLPIVALSRCIPLSFYVGGLHLLYQQITNKYDVWQIIGSYPAGYLACSLSGSVPLVLRTHGDDIQKDVDLNYGLRLDPHLENIIKKTLHKMDRVIALTESVTTCYKELDVPDKKIAEIPNGLNVERFNQHSDKRAIRDKWGLPTDKPLLLSVGRYHPKKGFSDIPAIARTLKDRSVPFFWLIVGKDTKKLGPIIEQEGVADVVRTEKEIGLSNWTPDDMTFQLPHDEVIRLYQCADIFAFPSRLETFGRVLIEAMAAGLAIVSNDVPGCRDVVTHKLTGLLAKPGDIEDMASHIQSLIENKKLRNRLVKNGSRHVQRYDWENVTDSYERLYRSLMPQWNQEGRNGYDNAA